MSTTPHEDRFVELLRFAAGESEELQELSIPRKVRRLDVVYRFAAAPVWFGALRETCCERVVAFEHESTPVARHAVSSAMVGQSWLAWERVRPAGRRRRSVSGPALLADSARPPLVIVVADRVSERPEGAVPGLRGTPWPGVWMTPYLDEGGLVLLDTSLLRARDGFAFWSWLGRPANPQQSRERLRRLLDDPSLPTLSKERLMEAVMENLVPHSEPEREGVYQRIKRELRREGLLSFAERVVPEAVERLRAIEDIEALEEAFEQALRDRDAAGRGGE